MMICSVDEHTVAPYMHRQIVFGEKIQQKTAIMVYPFAMDMEIGIHQLNIKIVFCSRAKRKI